MKNQLIFVFTIFPMLTFLSCRKDKTIPAYVPTVYDTIFPKSYLPAYPSSYWRYIDSNNNVVKITTDSSYVLDHYYMAGGVPSDSFYVPVYNHKPLWGYKEHDGYISNAASSTFRPLLSETSPIGSSWLIWVDGPIQHEREVIARDTAILVGGSVFWPTIIVEDRIYGMGFINDWTERRYYTKDVGMVKFEQHTFMDFTVKTYELFDYYINH